jgi:hypothetical protein
MSFLEILEASPFRALNFPPQLDEQPICPHYNLIETCAEFAEVQLNPNVYCGQHISNEDSIRPLSGFRGKKYEPITSCTKVYTKLLAQYLKAQTLSTDLVPVKNDSLIKKSNILIPPNFPLPKADKDISKNIIKKWRDLLGSGSDIIEKPDELPDKETIRDTLSQIELLLTQLAQIVKPEKINYWNNEAGGCKQSPKYDEDIEALSAV